MCGVCVYVVCVCVCVRVCVSASMCVLKKESCCGSPESVL